MKQQHRRVLVTGLTGFTGRHLRGALERAGYDVWGIGFASESLTPGMYVADLSDRSSLLAVIEEVRPQYVIHLAAISFVAHDDVENVYLTNIVGTRNLLSALASYNVTSSLRGVLLASSGNIYGNMKVDAIDEGCPLQPVNDYGVSKVAMEHMAELWRNHLPITFVRPFNYTGVGQSREFVVPKIIDAFARKASSLELGNLDVYRDFSDVRDIVDAYARLLELSPCEPINLCSERVYSLREILDIVQDLSGHTLDIKINSKLIRTNEVSMLRGSSVKLRRLIPDWRPRPLRDTLAWMFIEASKAISSDIKF
jgi:nucleoside-diphosphate-sugar epimerase